MNEQRLQRRGRRGSILLIAAGLMFTLLAFVGLAFDVGYVQWSRRRAQTAADAAALAGAWAVQSGGSATTPGKNGSKINGFEDGQNGVTVTINKPPLSGSYTGDPSAVEAIVSQDAPAFFSRIVGVNTLPVRARAVAKRGYGTACVYVLNPTVKSALKIDGNVTVTFGCGGIVESNNSEATTFGGNTTTVTLTNGASIGSVGGFNTHSATVSPSTSVYGGAVSPGDPMLTSLSMPTPPADPTTLAHYDASAILASGGTTLQPGVYCGGIHFTNTPGTVTFNPGLYILAGGGPGGGLQISSATVTGTGVTFYTTDDNGDVWGCPGLTGGNNAGPVQITASMTINAPTSGPYVGIAMFQNRADTYNQNNAITGNTTINGVLYFPTTALSFGGTSDTNGYLLLIADTIDFTGGPTLNQTLSLNNFPPEFANINPAFESWIVLGE